MSQAHTVDILHGEEVDVVARPHPMSFLKYYFFCAYLVGVTLFLGWLDSYLRSDEALLKFLSLLEPLHSITGMEPADIVLLILFWLILLFSGFATGKLWASKMPLSFMALVAVAGTALELYLPAAYETVPVGKPLAKLLLLGAAAVVGMVLTEAYRRGHVYVVTNRRIMVKKGFIRRKERDITYGKITDIHVEQGIFGRLFNYGTVIPVSASSFGVSADPSQAFPGTVDSGFGGARKVETRGATHISLYGIPDPRKIRAIMGSRKLKS